MPEEMEPPAPERRGRGKRTTLIRFPGVGVMQHGNTLMLFRPMVETPSEMDVQSSNDRMGVLPVHNEKGRTQT
jgi:hypothetical protein